MHLSNHQIMTPDLKTIMNKLNDAGHEAYMVGGCVRDAILGRPVSDVDISTSASPTEVHDALRGTFKLYPTGVEHGTWTVGTATDNYEVTSYRKDVATDGRRAVVEFSRKIDEDAYRRDFTMNALYMDADGNITDPTGEGLEDLHMRRIRFVGDAGSRCKEDYLRILRLFRFHAHIGNDAMDKQALQAAEKHAEGLRSISGERVWSELKKLLSAPDPIYTLCYMHRAGVLGEVFRGYRTDIALARSVVVAEIYGGYGPKWERRYFALAGHGCGIPFPAAKREKRHQETVKMLWERGHDVAANAYRTKNADAVTDAYILNTAENDPAECAPVADLVSVGIAAKMPLTSADLSGAGVLPSKKMGDKLRRAEDHFVSSKFQANKDILFRIAMQE